MLIVTSGGVVANQVKQHNDFIQITDQQELPLSHSLALGLTAPGGSNVNQTKKMRQLATKSERNKYAEKNYFPSVTKLWDGGFRSIFCYQKLS